jgi:hypothetical protein
VLFGATPQGSKTVQTTVFERARSATLIQRCEIALVLSYQPTGTLMQDSFNGWKATFLSLDERRQADRAKLSSPSLALRH